MKKQLGSIALVYPIPIVLIGADVNGVANFTTVGDCAVMGLNPALVVISLNKTHHTTRGIVSHRSFSINIPPTGLLDRADYCGMVSGRDVDKSVLFEVIRGETDVPLIAECPVNLECRVIEEVCVQHRQIFIAEVVQTHIDEDLISVEEGRVKLPEMTKLDPIVYALDNRYYAMGQSIGTGYIEGKNLLSSKQ